VSDVLVRFKRSPGGLVSRVSWRRRSADDAPAGFAVAITEDDLEDIRWYCEDFLDMPDGGPRVRAARVEASLAAWGRALHDAVFSAGDRRARLAVWMRGASPRRLAIVARDPEVLRLPWELLADSEGSLSARGVSIRRALDSEAVPSPRAAPRSPLRLLLVVSRPDDLPFIDPRQSSTTLLEALDPLGRGVSLDVCRPATRERMKAMLEAARDKGEPYRIVHFDGHGTFREQAQTGALCFEDHGFGGEIVATEEVGAAELGAILTGSGVSLAVLESCRSGSVSRVATSFSVAPHLLETGVESVLAMSEAVHVEATRLLMNRFYQELARGATVGKALEAGRAAMRDSPVRWTPASAPGDGVSFVDWFAPTLYQREDFALVPKGRARTATRQGARPARAALPDFPPAPRHGLMGRARDLLRLERLLLAHRAVVVHAMGGTGKTSLAREAACSWTRDGFFPDGACFLSFDRGIGPERIVQALGVALEGDSFLRRSAAAQWRRAAELFRTRRVLVVWDNFESVLPAFREHESVPLYSEEERQRILQLHREWTADPDGEGRLLVTGRSRATVLDGAAMMELRGLVRRDALALLARVAGLDPRSTRLDQAALHPLLDVLGDHPLSIELVGKLLEQASPDAIIADLRGLFERLEAETGEERNRSLRASFELSTRRLDPEAREALGWLGAFKGGVFEALFLWVSEMDVDAWGRALRALEATAIVTAHHDVLEGYGPYLRIHPALAQAFGGDRLGRSGRERFIGAYLGFKGAFEAAFEDGDSKLALKVMPLEEANLRDAILWALDLGATAEASVLTDSLLDYLELSGRIRERDAWALLVAERIRTDDSEQITAIREIDEAWVLSDQGRRLDGLKKLEALAAGFEGHEGTGSAFLRARIGHELGYAYHAAGRPRDATIRLEEAVARWDSVIAECQSRGEDARLERKNLSVALAYLAEVLETDGRLDSALSALRRSREADPDALADAPEMAPYQAGLILAKKGQLGDAERLLQQGLDLARAAGDRPQEARVYRALGDLALEVGRFDKARRFLKQAARTAQDLEDGELLMAVYNSLGSVELSHENIEEAIAWYTRATEIGAAREDPRALAAITHNRGIAHARAGKSARDRGDETGARACLEQAESLVREALQVRSLYADEPGEADSHYHLALIALALGLLDEAEAHAQRARAVYERLGSKATRDALVASSDIARARGDEQSALDWRRKSDALGVELRAKAGAALDVPPGLLEPAFLSRLQASVIALAQMDPDSPDIGSRLDAIATRLQPPLDALVPFLQKLVRGQLTSIPPDVPEEVRHAIENILETLATVQVGDGLDSAKV